MNNFGSGPLHAFGSDTESGVHPSVMQALIDANSGHKASYGCDSYTESARELFRQKFGECSTFFVCGGTAANVLALQRMARDDHNAIICTDVAHIHTLECGGPRRPILTYPNNNGKMSVQAIEHHMEHKGDKHHVQPSVVTITQPTELHTVYTAEEIGQIAECAHSNDLYLHMDGARIANAAASLNCSLREITSDAGVDALSFGGTKNGMLYGDAIVFFNERLGEDFEYTQKNGMQLMSKMWGITAQFEALLSDNYWIRNAEHANEMASYLETQLGDIPDLTITQPVETNAVFSVIETGVEDRDRLIRESIQQRYPFMMYEGQMRWVTSFDTLREDVNEFVRFIKVVIQKCSLIRCHER